MNELTVANISSMLLNETSMGSLMRFAEAMSQAVVMVPKHFHGKPADCLAITMQALRWGMDPFVVASKTYPINGILGYEAQLVVAVLKSSGAVVGRPHYEYRGDGPALECRAGFIPAGESEILWTEWLSSASVKVKNSPLWTTNPKQQMGYLQARSWARLYAPDALLGVYTADELEDSREQSTYRMPIPSCTAVQTAESSEPEVQILPEYPADEFEKNLPAWKKIVDSGKKTALNLLAILSTKATFSAEQRSVILALDQEPAIDISYDDIIDAPF